jgi:hypothetical protein
MIEICIVTQNDIYETAIHKLFKKKKKDTLLNTYNNIITVNK